MVGVDDDGGILQLRLLPVQLAEQQKVLEVIVWVGLAVLVHIAPQDGVGVGVPLGVHLPVAVDEGVPPPGRGDGVHHDGQVSGGGVFHAHRDLDAAGGQAVLLVFHAAGAHGHIGQQIIQIFVILGVEHFIRAGEAGLLQHAKMHFPYGDEAVEHVGLLLRVRLVEHTLVASAGGAGLVGVHPGNDENTLLHPLRRVPQPGHVVEDAVLPIRRAGPDDEQEPLVFRFGVSCMPSGITKLCYEKEAVSMSGHGLFKKNDDESPFVLLLLLYRFKTSLVSTHFHENAFPGGKKTV